MFWYGNQTMHVKWGNSISDGFKVGNGVRQGGVLSPYLFNVYMDELSSNLNKLNIGCSIGSSKINHVMYADDIALISPSVKGLQQLLNTCEQYGIDFGIKFNPNKSQIFIVRSKSHKNLEFPKFNFNGIALTEVANVKYLGHILSNDTSDDLDMMRQCRFLYAQGNGLIRKFHMCTPEVKSKLFKSYCTSIYTGPLWCNYRSATLNKVIVAYNSVLRNLLGIPRYQNGVNYSASHTCLQNGIPTFKILLRKLCFSFMTRLLSMDHNFVSNMVNFEYSSINLHSKFWCNWRKILYII